jgi:hypothetical protein
MEPVKQAFDKQWAGILLGIFAPLLAMYLFYLRNYSGKMPIKEFLLLVTDKNLLSPLLALCCLLNLGTFFLLYYLNRNYMARGVILGTMLYALVVMFLKLR